MRTLNLAGKWQLIQSDQRGHIAAQVPGCVHLDLLAAGRIPDPYYRDNENQLQWIGEKTWIYSRTFTFPKNMLQADQLLLCCDGLDTLATIILNGRKVGRADNMHRRWEFDVTSSCKPGVNRLEIRFDSVLPYIRRCEKKRHLPTWVFPGGSWVRKEPCNFGWDWGPRLITCGIWRNIELRAFDTARFADVAIRQQQQNRQVNLKISTKLERRQKIPLKIAACVAYKGKIVGQTECVSRRTNDLLQISIKNPNLWWPNGMGEQPLYEINVELRDGDGNLLDVVSRRIGLRTLELQRNKDRWGQSFQFVINGRPFFAKGADWIPADTFAPRVDENLYRRLLQSAADAHMNMLRVWGGGIYESETFYNLCDELGLCIWQDFMFACSTYPTFDKAFLANVRAEAEDNIKRLRHHACLTMWCGNNELEQNLVASRWDDKHMSWRDYSRLFDKLLPEVVRQYDPDRPYWPGSPHRPVGDREQYNHHTAGDAHLWQVWHRHEPFEWYRSAKHRFVSEFGFQSFPEPRTVETFTCSADRNITSPVMEHHQRHPRGNKLIMSYMLDWFRMPKNFEMTLWLSQILQAMGIEYGVEHFRRNRPRTMGTIYWQLNDCWPVASWASIDSNGRWKALHYRARRFYAPLLLSAVEFPENSRIELHVTSDLHAATSAKITWQILNLDGGILSRGSCARRIPGAKNTKLTVVDMTSQVQRYGRNNLLLFSQLHVNHQCVNTTLTSLVKPKRLELRNPTITSRVRRVHPGEFAITLKAKKPALWTWLELTNHDGDFSDNFLHLLPGAAHIINLKTNAGLSVAEVKRQLRIRSLFDTYES
ncbi:MAG: glycoside hydrolase family 2 protein [Sedimentisphaerales bacterium]|nr:glycoside hydrolase family 2 protein [Sedimentisphaerales bacterium]